MYKILIIEDQADFAEEIAFNLQMSDYETQVVIQSLEALTVATEFLPDVILCDIMMPEIDGYHVYEKLHANEMTTMIPFIFMSAMANRESIRQGMEIGADDYLVKPFTHQELIGAIETQVRKKKDREAGILAEQIRSRVQTRLLGDAHLTNREQEVIKWIVLGYSNLQIANRLTISLRTVEAHRANLMKKLNLAKTADLVRLALERPDKYTLDQPN